MFNLKAFVVSALLAVALVAMFAVQVSEAGKKKSMYIFDDHKGKMDMMLDDIYIFGR